MNDNLKLQGKRILTTLMAAACVFGCEPKNQEFDTAAAPSLNTPVQVQAIPIPSDSSLEDTLTVLASTIGERNLARYEKLEQTRDYISRRMEKAGYSLELNSFKGKLVDKEVHNLIFTKPGNEEILVVGAHYDSAPGTPGANDNGSGVAVLLHLAEQLKDTKTKKTIRFVFFVNEEPPYFMSSDMGSRVYAKLCAQQEDKIVGMLSLETMGYYSDEPGSQHFPPGINGYPDTGSFLAFVTEPKSQSFLQECLENFHGFPHESLVAPGGLEGVSWSDHASFWAYNYPAIMVTDTAPFRYPHYHRDSDTPDKINIEKLNLVAESLQDMLSKLASK